MGFRIGVYIVVLGEIVTQNFAAESGSTSDPTGTSISGFYYFTPTPLASLI
jgi:hypothetical protein